MPTRAELINAKRIVVKVGTHVLVNKNGRPDRRRIQRLVDDLSGLIKQGKEIILVSSGAIGAGLQTLGFNTRPKTLPELQMAAAVGQTRLLTVYHDFFAKHKITISQVLLTHDDLKNRTRHLNARNTLLKLINHRVIPIINENDVVSVDEIKFGDNDVLSALTATLVNADCLILLTTPNGLHKPTSSGRRTRVKHLTALNQEVWRWVQPANKPTLSTGGMESKLKSAQIALKNGVDVVIAPGQTAKVCQKVLSGADIGTYITKGEQSPSLRARKRWIAFFHKPQGQIQVDQGAAKAIQEQGKSLLAIGITEVHGNFNKGALVEIISPNGEAIATGLTDYQSSDIAHIKGCRSNQIEKILGTKDYDEVIHRDNLWVLEQQG